MCRWRRFLEEEYTQRESPRIHRPNQVKKNKGSPRGALWSEAQRPSQQGGSESIMGLPPVVGRGEGPGPAGMFSEDAEGGPRDPAPQPRVSPGRYVRGGGWEHVVRPKFCIWVSEHPEAWCQEQGLRWAEGRAQAL